MGITFLAAGTSIPDAYASIHVAKQVSNDNWIKLIFEINGVNLIFTLTGTSGYGCF